MLQGLRTVVYDVTDLARAREWYTELVGKPPYFDQPFYIGFDVAGYELGLHPVETQTPQGTSVVSYWGVENAENAYRALLASGAKVHDAVRDVGEGIKVASVWDPFGNIVGIIENPHFKLP
jgi:predicted enzyme related to lactoylglutathione lyase